MKKGTQILIRTDASSEIGENHVARCRALAAKLKASGAKVAFACRDLRGHAMAAIKKDGHKVFNIDEQLPMMTSVEDDADATIAALESANFDADWIVVDHPGLDSRWENRLKMDRRILAIDDLADRPHDCDILVDPTPRDGAEERYADLVPASAKLLLGPEFSLAQGADKIVKAMSDTRAS